MTDERAEQPMNEAELAGIEDRLGRAIDKIKPEPGMDGPHGGHRGGPTLAYAVEAMEAAALALRAERAARGRVEAALRDIVALGPVGPFAYVTDELRAAQAIAARALSSTEGTGKSPYAPDDDGDHSAFTHRDDDEEPPYAAEGTSNSEEAG